MPLPRGCITEGCVPLLPPPLLMVVVLMLIVESAVGVGANSTPHPLSHLPLTHSQLSHPTTYTNTILPLPAI